MIHMPKPFPAACLQMQPQPADIDANLARIGAAAASAAALGSRLLVTPEMAVTGYAIWDRIAQLAQPRDGAIVQGLIAIAREHRIAVAAGFPERCGDTVYNSVVLVQADGATVFYRKCHVYGPLENAAFSKSSAHSEIVEIAGIKAAMLICYDVEFPEMVRAAVLAGAQLLLVPTALPRSAPSRRVALSMVPTRAFENNVFIIYAGLCGVENETPYQGNSVIVGPDGEDLARAGMDETLLIATLDPARFATLQLDPYLRDRRPELYGRLL